jgi:hypothetical protein
MWLGSRLPLLSVAGSTCRWGSSRLLLVVVAVEAHAAGMWRGVQCTTDCHLDTTAAAAAAGSAAAEPELLLAVPAVCSCSSCGWR